MIPAPAVSSVAITDSLLQRRNGAWCRGSRYLFQARVGPRLPRCRRAPRHLLALGAGSLSLDRPCQAVGVLGKRRALRRQVSGYMARRRRYPRVLREITRVEALSDAVFAFAAALLVADLEVPMALTVPGAMGLWLAFVNVPACLTWCRGAKSRFGRRRRDGVTGDRTWSGLAPRLAGDDKRAVVSRHRVLPVNFSTGRGSTSIGFPTVSRGPIRSGGDPGDGSPLLTPPP